MQQAAATGAFGGEEHRFSSRVVTGHSAPELAPAKGSRIVNRLP